MSNKKHILTFIAEQLAGLFDEVAEIYGAEGAKAEILTLEMLLLSMQEEAPEALQSYLKALSEELPREDFDAGRMTAARNHLLDATATR